LVQLLRVGFRVSERRAGQVIGIRRSRYRYVSTAKDHTLLKLRVRDVAAARVRYGYRRVHVLLRREGWQVNHKRVYRLYRLQGVSLRLKTRRKRVSGVRVVQPSPTAPNQRWSMDVMSDSLYDGRRFRV
jgi:putative transposase